MPAAWYDVVIGNVHLFATDTVDFTNGTQKAEVSSKVKASTATWKIVFGHHPRYTSGEHFFDNQLLALLGLFDFQGARSRRNLHRNGVRLARPGLPLLAVGRGLPVGGPRCLADAPEDVLGRVVRGFEKVGADVGADLVG
jgi:hypothetical protein